MSVFEVLLFVLVSAQVHATAAELLSDAAALPATFTFRVIAEVPLTAIGVAESVQVTTCTLATHENPPPEPLTNVRPAGSVSVTVMVPLLAADPPFDTVRLYWAPCPCEKPPPTCA